MAFSGYRRHSVVLLVAAALIAPIVIFALELSRTAGEERAFDLLPAGDPIPLPDDSYIGEELPISGVLPIDISADEAIAIARANPSHLVGTNPVVRLMHVTRDAEDADGDLDAIGWVILSTDAQVPIMGGPARADSDKVESDEPVVSLAWVMVDGSGELLISTANTYYEADEVPPVPVE
jgi:hypothetical protein